MRTSHMAKRSKILDKILRGTSDANIGFADLCHLLVLLGFDERGRTALKRGQASYPLSYANLR
jgi:hypothetical protein